jgi:Ca2+-binding RTX toxin-like protein
MPTSFATNLILTGAGNLTATGNDLGDHITGNSGNDTLIAGIGSNVLDGSLGGADLLNGAQGLDTLIGGAGNTTFIVGNSADVVTAMAGFQNVIETSVNIHAPANIQTIEAVGLASISIWANNTGDVLIANAGADTLYGGAGADSFVAGSNADTFVAGSGTDTFWVNNAADVIQNVPTGSYDVVQSIVSYHLPTNAHELDLEGSSNLDGWATNSGSVLHANAGNDVLYGGTGNDILVAGAGLDTLIGGGGADTSNSKSAPLPIL